MAVDFSKAAQSALGWGGTGASLGSLTGNPIGLTVGAAGGGILGFLSSVFGDIFGNNNGVSRTKNKKVGSSNIANKIQPGQQYQSGLNQVPTITPEVQQILSFLMQQGKQGLQNPYEGFGDIENYANNNFNQQVVPSLAERFVGMNNGAASSPDFINQLRSGGSELSSNLALLKNQYGQQNKQNAMDLIRLGISPNQFQNVYNEQPSPYNQLANNALQSIPAIAQTYMAARQNNLNKKVGGK